MNEGCSWNGPQLAYLSMAALSAGLLPRKRPNLTGIMARS
ncbi:MAG: hypothetical protein OJF48_002601 [Afipia sp.]|nr:MAG: hypothetical protein OJF48_002601 [Afipia sp.]